MMAGKCNMTAKSAVIANAPEASSISVAGERLTMILIRFSIVSLLHSFFVAFLFSLLPHKVKNFLRTFVNKMRFLRLTD